MFAWILNTKPEKAASVGCTVRSVPSRDWGGGAHSTSASRISRTPKLLIAEPKNIGVCRPARKRSRSNGWLASRISSHVVAQRRRLVREQRFEPRVVEPGNSLRFVAYAILAGRKPQQPVMAQIEDAAKALAHADGPAHRRALDREHRLDFLQRAQSGSRTSRSILFTNVMIGVAREPAHLEELDRLRLDALCRVDHHHRRIDGREHAVGVLGKILVSRRVEQVDRMAGVLELHHRRRDRDAALLFDLHPVGSRVARALARLDGARHLDRAAEEQQLFGQRRLARIRVRDDRKRAAPRGVAHEIGRERSVVHRLGNRRRHWGAGAKQKPPAGRGGGGGYTSRL